MIPAELEPVILDLPAGDPCRIVVLTGTELRHDRFALRLQAEFPSLVVAWLQVEVPAGRPDIDDRERQKAAEHRIFAAELEQLESRAYLRPRIIRNLNTPETFRLVDSLEPYFLLTLGGGPYVSALRNCARGVALTQHDRWCPGCRGSYMVEWALYHRDLSKIGNTVHILTDGGEPGAILRSSSACLAIDDTPESCLARSVALGTELLCETVRELIDTRKARVFPQTRFIGHTSIGTGINKAVMDDIRHDVERGLIHRDLARRMAF